MLQNASTFEFDGWGGNPNGTNPPQNCQLLTSPNKVNCAWGALYHTGGLGISGSGNEAQHGGAAFGVSYYSYQDFLKNGATHGLAFNIECAETPVYPGDTSVTTDNDCSNGSGPTPGPAYGENFYLKNNSTVNAAIAAASVPCQGILTTLQNYGGYVEDTENTAIQINMQGPDPTTQAGFYAIYAQMAAGGDGSGSGANFTFSSCLNRVNNAADWSTILVKNTYGYGTQ
jgi:hypothetical protein